MAQFGKTSSKRGKPTYAYAIIGVSLVLFLFGIVGWFFLNLRKTGDLLKESIQVHAYLSPTAKKNQVDSVMNYINSLPYANRVEYIDKEKALKMYEAENDSTWRSILEANPLPESIDFFIKADYVQEDSLRILSDNLYAQYPGVISQFQFPTTTITKISKYVKIGGVIFLVLTALLTILVVFSIDNTIRLAMYSNRFLIKTMQMVGATRGFIARPLNQRAIINGFISACIAIVAILITVKLIEQAVPDFKYIRDNNGLILLFLVIIVLGITISLASTYRSVIKYLKMKLDDLY